VNERLLECASKYAPEIRVFEALNRGMFLNLDLIFTFQKKKFRTGRRASTKNEPKPGRFFSGQSFLGCTCANKNIEEKKCTHKHLQTSHETQLEGPGVFITLGGSYFYRSSTTAS
jgi:hypothetical protein